MNPQEQGTPLAPRFPRTDSLVFSITAQKMNSPHDTDLLHDSYQIQASKQINQLNNKLGTLQNKIKALKTQQIDMKQSIINENIDISNLQLQQEKQRYMVGKFHKKNSIKNHINGNNTNNQNSSNVTVRNNKVYSQQSRTSNIHNRSILQKQSQIKNLRNQMIKLRMKIEKSERSMSRCSQRLSETKQSVKNLQSTKKTNQRVITNLVKQLKKSQNIRKKQKQTIIKQKKQIEQLRNLVSILKGNLRG